MSLVIYRPQGAFDASAIAMTRTGSVSSLALDYAGASVIAQGTGATRRTVDGRAAWVPVSEPGDEARIFDHRIALKVLTSKVAMHLDGAWRAGLFRSLDTLLDGEEWDFSDALPSEASFKTFLRMIVYLSSARRPSLGATADGHIVAAWTCGQDRLTIECLPDDSVRWVLAKCVAGERVSGAGRSSTRFLIEALRPYSPEQWLSDCPPTP